MNLLKQLELDELSLVDRPANASAKVALFKRDSNEEIMEKAYKMTEAEMKEMDKMSDDMKAKMHGYMNKGYTYREAMKMMDEEDMKKAMSDEDKMEMDKMSDGDKKKLRAMMSRGMSFGDAMREINKSAADEDISLEAELISLKEKNELLTKTLIENGFVVKADTVEKKEEVETIEVSGEMVVKSDIPAPVLKALEEAEVQKRQTELRKSAEAELPHFDVEVAMQLLDVVKGDEKVLEALKGADAAFAAAMDETGEKVVDGDMHDPQTKLDKMVEAHATEHGVNKYAAFDAISKTAEGKALIAKTYEKDE